MCKKGVCAKFDPKVLSVCTRVSDLQQGLSTYTRFSAVLTNTMFLYGNSRPRLDVDTWFWYLLFVLVASPRF